MITPQDVQRLTESTEQNCLTLYFNSRPDQPRSNYVARFRKLLREVEANVPSSERKQFDATVAKVTNFLTQYQPDGSSFFIVAGPKAWDEVHSRVPVRDEVSWGRPNTAQLLWLLDEYRPYGLLVASLEHVRFLAVRLNEFEEFREFAASIDTSEWRKQRLPSTGRGEGAVRGGRDVNAWDDRYAEQVRHFWKSLHKPLTELVERYHIQRVVLAGGKTLLPEFAKSLPPNLAGKVVAQQTLDTFTSPSDAVKRLFPEITAWEQKRDKAVLADLLNAAGISKKAAVGVDPVLKFLQEGRAARILIAQGFDHEVSRCGKCALVGANIDGSCPRCSATDIKRASLAAILPRLLIDNKLPVHVLKGDAGAELARGGGVGAFLRF